MMIPLVPPVVPPLSPYYPDHPYQPQPPRTNEKFRQLVWSIQGPLEDSVFVTGDEANSNEPPEPFLRRTPEGDIWHPLSNESVAELPIKSMTVSERWLDDSGEFWQLETHWHCAEVGEIFERVYQDKDWK